MRTTRTIASIGALATLTLGGAACSSDDSGDDPGPDDPIEAPVDTTLDSITEDPGLDE